ncbi:MAG: hypothetical protein D8M58_08110 [Calditrichaeota bacterium]|nr:MAG: hypothetical protein DWQ03_18380 [Calditrichota bacterium]MBL1205346.1 hypothetical protein [Calditrichota bacterium]NOG45175.1 hypothetical protein [Calditrichota bacterium]
MAGYSALANKKSEKYNNLFVKILSKVLLAQIIFQIIFTGLLFFVSHVDIGTIQYVNISSYILIFILSLFSLKYSIANRPLVMLFIVIFFYLAVNPIVLLFGTFLPYNLQIVITTTLMLLITSYLFFYSISPKADETFTHLLYAFLITATIILLTYANLDIFFDYTTLDYSLEKDQKTYWDLYSSVQLGSYYVYLVNFSLLLFIWFIYNQGQYILSEYLASLIAIHTLMIVNEIYQLYNHMHLYENYIEAQYFNAVINIGYISIWIIRLQYLSSPESEKNEKYIQNYDLLKGFVSKPINSFWRTVLTKLGKQRLLVGSVFLFLIICIPSLFFGELDYLTRFNIILMFLFLFAVIIYAIVYTQRKWFTHIGFLIKRKEK